MRWPVFLVVGFVMLALEKSVVDLLTLHALGRLAPSFVACLVVFVAMWAPRMVALWAGLLLGVLMDLSQPLAQDPVVHLVGPHALGYVLGVVVVLQLRAMVFRRNVLTLAALTALFLLAAHLVAVSIFVARSWYAEPPIQWTHTTALGELLRRAAMALYAGVVAIPVGWVLLQSFPLWGFHVRR